MIAFRLAVCGVFLLSLASAAAGETQRQLWITNAYGDDVHVYDVATHELIRRIVVGPNPHGISATADGRVVHIALENFGGPTGELAWIDTATGEVTKRAPVGPKPNENECTPDGRWIYVPCEDGLYYVVDGETGEIASVPKRSAS